MNWELVGQIVVIILVLAVAALVAAVIREASKQNEHKRMLERRAAGMETAVRPAVTNREGRA